MLPFGYESTGVETRFTCGLDPVPTSRRVFSFHRPETMAQLDRRSHREPEAGALRAGLRLLPDLDPRGLWPAQAEAIRGLEASLRDNRPRALIQMTMGSRARRLPPSTPSTGWSATPGHSGCCSS